MVPIALTIASYDTGGGAGVRAGLKTFSALGVYSASVIFASTAQNTRAITTVEPVTRRTAPRHATRNTYGTGSMLFAAIAAADSLGVGSGHGPVHHFHEVWAND